MSIPVDVADLATALAAVDEGYLLSVSAHGRVKVVSLVPELDEGRLVVRSPGRGTLANLQLNTAVTLVFPPRERGGHTLLVDGTATLAGGVVHVEATGAVLHRPAEA